MANDKPPIIKLAQPGFDVKTAGDENLIYNSNWPLLKTANQGSYTTKNVKVNNTIVEHNLGFIPMFWYFANTPIAAWQNSGAVGTEARSEFMGPVSDGTIEVTANKLSLVPSSFPVTSGSMQMYYYIFALDITKQYDAPVIKVGSVSGPRDINHVFKIAKEGKDVSSDNLFDFIVHSRCRSPLIHSVNPTPGVVKNFTVQHNLGYLPMFFGYEKTASGSYKAMITGQGGSSSFQSNENQIVFADTGGKEISIVILKDPFLIDYTVSVSV